MTFAHTRFLARRLKHTLPIQPESASLPTELLSPNLDGEATKSAVNGATSYLNDDTQD